VSYESLDEKLKKLAHDVCDNRMEQWAKYYFEKELLPALKYELKERLLVQLLTSIEQHGKIELDITFKPKESK